MSLWASDKDTKCRTMTLLLFTLRLQKSGTVGHTPPYNKKAGGLGFCLAAFIGC